MLNQENSRRAEELFQSALERDLDQRAAFVANATLGNEQLRLEVESLLRQVFEEALSQNWQPAPCSDPIA